MLPLLDDHEFGAHGLHGPAGADQVFVIGQQPGFAVVEHQPIQTLEQSGQLVALGVNPQVHRVGHDQRRAGHLIEHLHLHHRRAIGQKQIAAAAISLGQHRIEFLEHVQMHFQRLAIVHVRQIPAAPAECLCPADDVQARGVDPPAGEQGRMLGRKVFAHHAHQPHGREITGRIGKIGGRAAQHIVAPLAGGFDTVQSNRSDDEQRHGGERGARG